MTRLTIQQIAREEACRWLPHSLGRRRERRQWVNALAGEIVVVAGVLLAVLWMIG